MLTAAGCVHPDQTDHNVMKNEEFKKQNTQTRIDFTKKRQEASYDKQDDKLMLVVLPTT